MGGKEPAKRLPPPPPRATTTYRRGRFFSCPVSPLRRGGAPAAAGGGGGAAAADNPAPPPPCAWIDDQGRVLGLEFTHLFRCGWAQDLSLPVADRAMLHADNCYHLPNIHIESHRLKTNT